MNVTGYRIRRALKVLEMYREQLNQEFNESFQKYSDQTRDLPTVAYDKVSALEEKIAKLQAAQTEYNSKVSVTVGTQSVSLAYAVKRAGSAGRQVNMWKFLAKQVTNSYTVHYGRKSDDVVPVQTITAIQATAYAVQAEKYASELRGAIAEGNSTSIDIPSLDPDLLTE